MPNNVTVTIISATLTHVRWHHVYRISTATTTTQKDTILLTQPHTAISGTGLERGGHGERPRARVKRRSARRHIPRIKSARHTPHSNNLSRVRPLSRIFRQSGAIGANHRLSLTHQPLKALRANLINRNIVRFCKLFKGKHYSSPSSFLLRALAVRLGAGFLTSDQPCCLNRST